MKVYKDGIYKTINADEYGIYLAKGFVKVINEEKVKSEPIIEEIKVGEPIEEKVDIEPEIEIEKPKRNRRK